LRPTLLGRPQKSRPKNPYSKVTRSQWLWVNYDNWVQKELCL